MKNILIIFIFIGILTARIPASIGAEIALEKTHIPEGNFSINLYKPQRSELPIRETDIGITTIGYSYRSYFSAFDVSYVAGFTDWTASKEYEIKKYGFTLNSAADDLHYSFRFVKAMIEKRLQVPVRQLSSQELTYETYPGREIKFEFDYSGLHYRGCYRIYIIEHKDYWHQVVYPEQYENYVRPESFLNSFRIGLHK